MANRTHNRQELRVALFETNALLATGTVWALKIGAKSGSVQIKKPPKIAISTYIYFSSSVIKYRRLLLCGYERISSPHRHVVFVTVVPQMVILLAIRGSCARVYSPYKTSMILSVCVKFWGVFWVKTTGKFVELRPFWVPD